MEHNHHHHHHHDHSDISFNKQFKIGVALNLLFVIVELIFGIIYNSLALIADAGHNFSDVIGLLIAWAAGYLVTKKPTNKYTYGYKKSSIIGAQLNSLILLVAIGIIIWEAINRLTSPPEVEGTIMIVVAGIGVIINGFTTYLFVAGKDSDLNIKGAYLHMLADTLISVGVVISGIIILFTNFSLIDPSISIVIALIIFGSTWKLFKDATKLSLDGVPDSVDLDAVKNYFNHLKEIKEFHHLHIWALSTSENALTVHLVLNDKFNIDKTLKKINHDLEHDYKIKHSTIQFENIKCEELTET